MASAIATWELTSRWQAEVQLSGYGGTDHYTNAALLFNWHAAPGWDLGIGARYISRTMNDGGVYNEFDIGDLVFTVKHGFH